MAGQTLKEVGVEGGAQTDPGLGQRHILTCKQIWKPEMMFNSEKSLNGGATWMRAAS